MDKLECAMRGMGAGGGMFFAATTAATLIGGPAGTAIGAVVGTTVGMLSGTSIYLDCMKARAYDRGEFKVSAVESGELGNIPAPSASVPEVKQAVSIT